MGSGAKFGGESDLGFVIDSAQLFSSTVHMREMWYMAQNHLCTELLQAGRVVTAPHTVTVAQSHTNSATIAPAERGQSIRVWTVGCKKDKSLSPNCPRDAGDCLNAVCVAHDLPYFGNWYPGEVSGGAGAIAPPPPHYDFRRGGVVWGVVFFFCLSAQRSKVCHVDDNTPTQ